MYHCYRQIPLQAVLSIMVFCQRYYRQLLTLILILIPFRSALCLDEGGAEQQGFIKQSPAFYPNNLPDTSLWSVLLSLFLVIVLILLLAWLLKRFHPGMLQQQNLIKIISVLTIGKNEKLMIVDVSGEQILLGITGNQIQALHVLKEPVESNAPAIADNGFSIKLQNVLTRNNDK